MSGSERNSKRVALAQDADEFDNPIEGTEKYAESVASPQKERPNTGRTRREKTRRDSSSPQTSGLTDSDSTIHPRGEKSERDRSRRESREYTSPHKKGLAISQQTLAMRPAPKHANTTPHYSYVSSDNPSYYGVPATTVTPGVSGRPRARTAQRPASYYGGEPSRPPPSNPQFYARQQTAPAPMMPTSYPPPSWTAPLPMGYPMMSPAIPPPPRQQGDYFANPPPRDLRARFNSRPLSAMGMRPAATFGYEDYEPEEVRPIQRRPSKSAKDRIAMPPPARPQSARPGVMFRAPTTPAPKNLRFEDEEYSDLMYVSPHGYAPASRTRRPSFGATSMSYDSGPSRIEVASNSRRNSYRNSVGSLSDYEEKLRHAQAYQDDVQGGPQMPLTAETLRRASKNGSSSRSTRSTASRDESDYRQSATTRTTRSSTNNNDDENVTIRIKGVRSVEVGGARMHCDDGAEISIAPRAPASGYRGGSDRSSYIGNVDDHHRIEDRRLPRIERPPTRTRTSSQAGSFSRTPRYESVPVPALDRYGYPPPGYPLPPHPNYQGGYI